MNLHPRRFKLPQSRTILGSPGANAHVLHFERGGLNSAALVRLVGAGIRRIRSRVCGVTCLRGSFRCSRSLAARGASRDLPAFSAPSSCGTKQRGTATYRALGSLGTHPLPCGHSSCRALRSVFTRWRRALDGRAKVSVAQSRLALMAQHIVPE